MTVYINPGGGDVPQATVENARRAVELFLDDCHTCGWTVEWDGTLTAYDGSRWDTKITVGGVVHEVSMPGDDPDRTRRSEPWVSYRLYVDGSSWLWGYALNMVDPQPGRRR